MKASMNETAALISRGLISASNRRAPTRTWNASLEQTLHRLVSRDSLTPPLVAQVIDPFLINHHSLALGFFNWASQQPGFNQTSITYQSILKSLSISRQFNAIDKLLKQVKARRINLDPSIYRSVIASQVIASKTQEAFSVFNEVSSMGNDIGPSTCNSLLAALASEGYLDNAQKVFEVMCLRNVVFSTLGFGVFVWRFCRNLEMGKILSLLDEVRKRDTEINGSIVAVLIVHGLCQASRVSEASWIMEELRKRDLKPDFMAYRIVAEAFRLTGGIDDMEKTLKRKRKLGVAPRSTDYNEFIFNLISERRICEAKELGEMIISGNFPTEDDVLNALIGSVSVLDPVSALLFLKFMIGKDRLPTLLTLSNVCRNLCKHGESDKLLEVFQILSANEFFSDLERFNVMVSFLCKAGRMKDAYGVLQEMKKKGLGPDVSSYNAIMEACCREDLLRPAKRLWDEMFASGCVGNLRTYNILIQKFSEIGQIEEAQRLFHHMLERGVAPDATTYRSLLAGLCHGENVDAAFEVFDTSVKHDPLLAQSTLSTFILQLCKNGSFLAASKLLCSVSETIGNPESHVTLLRALADAGEIPIAIEHIRCVEDTLPSMLQAIYNELLGSLSSSSEPVKILQLLQAMQGRSVSTNDT